MMLDPFVAGRDTGGGSGGAGPSNGFAPERQAGLPPKIALAYDSVMPAPQPAAFAQRWSAWASASAAQARPTATRRSARTTSRPAPTARPPAWTIISRPTRSRALRWPAAASNWGLAQGLGGGRSDAFQAGVYGKTNFGPAYVAAAFAFANHWINTDRTRLRRRPAHRQLQGPELWRRVSRPAIASPWRRRSASRPMRRCRRRAFHTPGYSETDLSGGGFALTMTP